MMQDSSAAHYHKPSHSSVLYVYKVITKSYQNSYIPEPTHEKKQNYSTLLCLCLENYLVFLGATTKTEFHAY